MLTSDDLKSFTSLAEIITTNLDKEECQLFLNMLNDVGNPETPNHHLETGKTNIFMLIHEVRILSERDNANASQIVEHYKEVIQGKINE